jgi:hypothetical protein
VAPTVVRVVRDLHLDPFDPTISITRDHEAAAKTLAETWGLGGSMDRAVTALGARSPVEGA